MDALACPVCFTVFEGRILQCSQGHAVCENCRLQLTNCPQCRGDFSGTRNFALEEVINRLKRTKLQAKKKKGKGTAAAAAKKAGAGAATTTTDKNKKKRPIVKSRIEANGPIVVNARPPEYSSSDDFYDYEEDDDDDDNFTVDDFEDDDDDDDDADEDMLLLLNAAPFNGTSIEQAAGEFICRMTDCNESLPICRMLNHIRYNHKNHLIELVNDLCSETEGDYQANWKVRANTFTKTIFMKKSGIFFLIINVDQLPGKSEITGWVQKVGTNDAARDFRFTLRIKIGLVAAVYSSFVYGAQTNIEYILERQQCLHFTTATQNKNMDIALEIGRNRGAKDQRRLDNTVVTSVAVEPNAAPSRSSRRRNARRGGARGGGGGGVNNRDGAGNTGSGSSRGGAAANSGGAAGNSSVQAGNSNNNRGRAAGNRGGGAAGNRGGGSAGNRSGAPANSATTSGNSGGGGASNSDSQAGNSSTGSSGGGTAANSRGAVGNSAATSGNINSRGGSNRGGGATRGNVRSGTTTSVAGNSSSSSGGRGNRRGRRNRGGGGRSNVADDVAF